VLLARRCISYKRHEDGRASVPEAAQDRFKETVGCGLSFLPEKRYKNNDNSDLVVIKFSVQFIISTECVMKGKISIQCC